MDNVTNTPQDDVFDSENQKSQFNSRSVQLILIVLIVSLTIGGLYLLGVKLPFGKPSSSPLSQNNQTLKDTLQTDGNSQSYSLKNRVIKESGSVFTAPVDEGDGIALHTVQGIVQDLPDDPDGNGKLLVLVRPDGVAVEDVVSIDETTSVTIVEYSKTPVEEQDGTYLDVKRGDSVMVSYNINRNSKEITIAGIRITR